MKKAKTALCILIAAALLLVLACGSGSPSSTSPQTQDIPQQTPEADSGPEAADTAPEDAEEAGDVAPTEAYEPGYYPVSLPIAEETVEFDFVVNDRPFIWNYVDDLSETLSNSKLEENTNVHINWIFFTTEGGAQQLQVMVASDTLPDFVYSGNRFYTGGVSKGYEDGVFLRLNDYIDEYMPNFKSHIEADELLYKDLCNENGDIIKLCMVGEDSVVVKMGPLVRADWLEKVGMSAEKIVTYDDWHEMLTRFKTELDVKSPLYMLYTGMWADSTLSAGYDVNTGLWPASSYYTWQQVDGEVQLGVAQPEFKEFLTMLNQWYTEGLFDLDCLANSKSYTNLDQASILAGDYGVFNTSWEIVDEYITLGSDGDPDFDLASLAMPLRSEGQQLKLSGYTFSRSSFDGEITSGCEDVETLCRYLDYSYSYEGGLINSYGAEGLSYEIVNGEPQIIESFIEYNDIVGSDGLQNVRNICLNSMGAFWKLESAFRSFYSDTAVNCSATWKKNCNTEDIRATMQIPAGVSVPSYISSDYSYVMTEIMTYVEQMVPKFIFDMESLEDGWDEYLETLNKLGLEEATGYYQEAYDNYWTN